MSMIERLDGPIEGTYSDLHPDSAVSEVQPGQVTRPEPHFGSPGLSFVGLTIYAKSRLLGRLDC